MTGICSCLRFYFSHSYSTLALFTFIISVFLQLHLLRRTSKKIEKKNVCATYLPSLVFSDVLKHALIFNYLNIFYSIDSSVEK